MSGLLPVGGATIALTGAGLGLGLTWTANPSVTGNIWKATCSALADQSGNGRNYTQPTATAQPIVTTGLNGKPGLLFDGVDDLLQAVGTSAVLPATFQALIVARLLNPAAATQVLLGSNNAFGTLYTNTGSRVQLYRFALGPFVAFASTAFTRFGGLFLGTTGDTVQAGAASATGVSAGTSPPGDLSIGANTSFSQFGAIEFLMAAYAVPAPLAAFDAALNSPQGYGPASIAV
jgi:hypothetical protein